MFSYYTYFVLRFRFIDFQLKAFWYTQFNLMEIKMLNNDDEVFHYILQVWYSKANLAVSTL